ncbi:MAG: hypothetical protein PHT07_22970 [Paludibacter sp.]|nr:hypothetical protein [Paludibacter sp.]
MRTFTLFILLIASTMLSAQIQLTDVQMKVKLDSILFEGNLLYRYEKAAWISIDMAKEKKSIEKDFFSYLVYHEDDTVKALILNKKLECIYEFRFVFQFDNPISDRILTRTLTKKEQNLVSTKTGIINKIMEQKIPLGCPDGYGLNMILMPREDGYKLYIITGTNKPEVIPFGNDYLFMIDDSGNIQSWKKIHSRLISMGPKSPNGEKVKEIFHSHLSTEPFISATDICTFMLYGKLCGLNSFGVYSPVLRKFFRYKLDGNMINIEDK